MQLDLVWDSISRSRWEELFASAGRTPLLQSWAWGEAKAAAEGWHPRRGVLSGEDGTPVALVQVLEKRLAGIVRVARLNRGPVWLVPASQALRLQALRLIAGHWRWWRGGVMFLAPEWPREDAEALTFRKRNGPSWSSAWLDLADPGALRKRFDGKWRNMLVGAEKAGLSAEMPGDLDWLMTRYEELMHEHSFSGTPPSLIRQLASYSELLVLRAITAEGEAVGGILVARHGASATYLVGWNGDAGRKLKANNFLLWQAIIALSEQGCQWLDLGGIDAALTPGIAAFKRGMNGEEYCLAGEYLSY